MPGYALLVPIRPGRVAAPLWRALREADGPRTIPELHAASAAHPQAIRLRLARWLAAGLVSATDSKPRRFSMIDDNASPPRMHATGALERRPSGRQRMWQAMRVRKRFDLPELMMVAEVSRRAAETYVNHLARAGYVRMLSRGNSMLGTWSVYLLVRRSGRLAPAVNHGRSAGGGGLVVLIDRNDGTRHDISPAAVSLRRPPAPADGGEN